ncbi:MAG: DUF4446 family protein [Armatimonadetes bacterium]|nr:DUF4446 family protein [Candidatus Hippobium faecium]
MMVFCILAAVLFIYCIFLNIQIIKLKNGQRVNFGKGDEKEIYSLINSIVSQAETEKKIREKLSLSVSELQKEIKFSIKKVGLHRYDIGDTGGSQSFSLALLNDDNAGIIIRGMFTRETSRLYCIKIDRDGSDRELQEEDIIALKSAVRQ